MEEPKFTGNPEHLAKLKEGVDVWNKWRKDNPKINPNLKGVLLNNAKLGGADLSKTNLSNANLHSANLYDANMNKVNLKGTILCDADIVGADLSKANLRGAILSGANMSWAKLRGANLRDTDLSWVKLNNAELTSADITGTLWYQVTTFEWNIIGIKCEYLYRTFDHDSMDDAHKITFKPHEFEKKYMHIERIIEMTLNMPFTDLSGTTGRFIADSINHIEKTEIIKLKAVEALSDDETKLSFMVFNDGFYTDKKHLIEAVEEAINNHIKKNLSLVAEKSKKLPDAVEELTGGVFKSRDSNIPFVPIKLDSVTIQEKAVELYIKTGKLGETIFNIVYDVFNR